MPTVRVILRDEVRATGARQQSHFLVATSGSGNIDGRQSSHDRSARTTTDVR